MPPCRSTDRGHCKSPFRQTIAGGRLACWTLVACCVWTRPAAAGESPALDRELAEKAWNDGQFTEAAGHSLRAFRARPQHAVHLYNAARALHRAQHCAEALRWYRTYLDLAPENADRRGLATALAAAIEDGSDLDCPAPPPPLLQIVAPGGPPTSEVPNLGQRPLVPELRVRSLTPRPRVWAWTLLGTGLVALAGGTWLVSGTADRLQAPDPTERQEGRRWRDAGLVSASLGAVSTSLGAWMLLRPGPAEQEALAAIPGLPQRWTLGWRLRVTPDRTTLAWQMGW